MSAVALLNGVLGQAAAEVAESVNGSVVEVRLGGHGGGSGVVWRSDGIVVTNHHVARADRAEVRLAGGRTILGTIVARDPYNDLALLRVPASGLPAASIGNARTLRVGEIVLAIGHPFGIRNAVTLGIVSHVAESADGDRRELVHADLLLGPGNSGGPMTDARGRVVGINAMVSGRLAMAVPSHIVQRLVATLGDRAGLGIAARVVELPPMLGARAPLAAGRGLLVIGVMAGSPAERAGLMVGDILVSLDGQPLAESETLLAALARSPVAPMRLGLLRGGVPGEAVVTPEPIAQRAA